MYSIIYDVLAAEFIFFFSFLICYQRRLLVMRVCHKGKSQTRFDYKRLYYNPITDACLYITQTLVGNTRL
jgi:hypothetical protein